MPEYSLYLQATQMLAASYAICGQIEQAEKVYQIAEQDLDTFFMILSTEYRTTLYPGESVLIRSIGMTLILTF